MPSCEPSSRSEPFSQSVSWTIVAIATLVLILQPGNSSGQQYGVPIQLPTTSVFGVNTTVSVPDGGSISLGGNSGSAWSSNRSGGPLRPFGNRAIGGSQFAGNTAVHVQIISLSEMEADLLSQLPRDRSVEDYARSATPEVELHQALHSAALQIASPNPPDKRNTSQTESRFRDSNDSSRTGSRQPAGSQVTPGSQSRFTTDVVDPNGSKQVQDKADFMSRHIGRKKK